MNQIQDEICLHTGKVTMFPEFSHVSPPTARPHCCGQVRRTACCASACKAIAISISGDCWCKIFIIGCIHFLLLMRLLRCVWCAIHCLSLVGHRILFQNWEWGKQVNFTLKLNCCAWKLSIRKILFILSDNFNVE